MLGGSKQRTGRARPSESITQRRALNLGGKRREFLKPALAVLRTGGSLSVEIFPPKVVGKASGK